MTTRFEVTYAQDKRREVFMPFVPSYGKGLEIGAETLPTFYKDEQDIDYLDYLTRADHEKLCSSEHFLRVPETDILVISDSYSEYTKVQYDYVIANHVIEHAPDVIFWLREISKLLSEGGFVFLTIPDKKFSFDKYRAETSFSHLVTDFFLGGEHSEKEHIVEISILYDQEFVKKEMEVDKYVDIDFLHEQIKKKPWIGLHRHVFQAETFQHKIIEPLSSGRFIDLSLVYCSTQASELGEFYCVLQKNFSPCSLDKDKFLGKIGGGQVSDLSAKFAREDLAEDVYAQLAESNAQLTTLLTSRSWRITAPLRKLASLFR